jgi:hypothetical protein
MQEIIQLLIIGACVALAFTAKQKENRQLSAFLAIGLAGGMIVEFILRG